MEGITLSAPVRLQLHSVNLHTVAAFNSLDWATLLVLHNEMYYGVGYCSAAMSSKVTLMRGNAAHAAV